MALPSESPSSCGFTFLRSVSQSVYWLLITTIIAIFDNKPCEDIEDKEDEDEDEPCEDIEELCEEALVHVARHLVENQPVAQRTVLHIVAHLFQA